MIFNIKNAKLAAVASLVSFGLGACKASDLGLGGGDDDPPVAIVQKPVAIGTPGATPSANVKNGGGLFFYIPDASAIRVTDKSSAEGNGTTTTFSNDGNTAQTSVAGTMAGGRTIGNLREMGLGYANLNGAEYKSGDRTTGSGHQLLLYSQAGTSFMQHSGYGFAEQFQGTVIQRENGDWDFDPTKPISVTSGAIFGGNATAQAEMPRDVTATYAGSFVGLGLANNGTHNALEDSPVDLRGDVRMSANFGSGAVEGNVYNMQKQENETGEIHPLDTPFGIVMNGQIDAGTGNTFQGTAAFTNGGANDAAIAGATTSSALVGGFYGPGAAEAAGALRVEGNVGQHTDLFVQGSFGTVRQQP